MSAINTKTIRAAIYIRTSTAEQHVENQLAALQDIVVRRKLELVKVSVASFKNDLDALHRGIILAVDAQALHSTNEIRPRCVRRQARRHRLRRGRKSAPSGRLGAGGVRPKRSGAYVANDDL
jgi:hypothetical protein